MSVDFWMPQAPVEKVFPYPEEDPEFWMAEPVAPFVAFNFSNGNAAAIARLVDPSLVSEDGVFGTWDMADLPIIRRQIMRVLNTREKELEYVDPFISQAPGRCTMISGGRDEEYINRRLNDLLTLVKVAMDHGFPVSIG